MWSTVRAGAHEAIFAFLTQPLLPLFYLIGRRMGGGASGVPVILIHGYSQNRVDFLGLARALSRAGAGPLYGFNYPWFATVHSNAERLERFVEEVCAERGATKVDLVCHSLGGLVAMEYVRTGGEARVRKIVTIASPHAGVVWKGPIVGTCAPQLRAGSAFLAQHGAHAIGVPCLSISSTHDNIVHPASTSALAHRGGRDIVFEGPSHLAILFSRATADAVVAFVCADEARAPVSARAAQSAA
jgi:pimeloyl-ACP methyl ester carboxylesterase